MKGLHLCKKCGEYYTEPTEFYDKIDLINENNAFYEAIIVCNCKNKRIAGGEFSEFYEGIMMFGCDFDSDKVKSITDTFDAIMLIECQENDPDRIASTYKSKNIITPGRMVYLKPKPVDYVS